MASATATEPRVGESADPTFRQLGELVERERARLRVPGVAVGVVHEGREEVAGFGVTSVEQPLPVDADTLFQIGSTTKTVTATAAMRLVEAGKLDLDAPVRTYLPKLRLAEEEVAARVTLRHLFNHTGGWTGDFFADTGMGGDALRRIVARMATLRQLTPLGAVWSYNNAGFYLAGRAMEVAAGKPYETIVKELVLDPLGMERSFFFAWEVMLHRFAVGHTVEGEGDEAKVAIARPWPLPRAAHPAGGLSSSVRDQLAYARFQMGDGAAPDGTRLLRPETMAAMQAPATPAGGMAGAVGITWMVKEIGGVKTVRHGGATNGQLSAFIMAPGRGFAITVLTNANRGGELHNPVTKWALQHYLGIAEPAPAAPARTAEELVPYAGHYEGMLTDGKIAVEDGSLVLRVVPKKAALSDRVMPAPPPSRLALLDGDAVVALDPPFKDARGEFLRGEDGAIAWLRFGGRILQRGG